MDSTNDNNKRFQYLGNNPSSDVPILSLIISSTILNMIFYKCLPSKLSPLYKSYIVSTVHAIISVLSVINYFLKYQTNFRQTNRMIGGGVYGSGDEIMVYSICFTCGYLFYDFLLMLIDKSVRSNGAIFHHVIIFLTFFVGLIFHIGHPCHFFLLFEELSTIPLNLKTFYRNSPRLHNLFSVLFAISFLSIRLVYGTIVCGYAFLAAPHFLRLSWSENDMLSFNLGFIQIFLSLLTRFLNFYWSFLIIRKIVSVK